MTALAAKLSPSFAKTRAAASPISSAALRRAFLLVLGCWIASPAAWAQAEEAVAAPAQQAAGSSEEGDAPLGSKWIRVREDDGKPRSLQTAIIRYVSGKGDSRQGVTVDLIGAVHVGDRSYYSALNDRFRQYDALLFELIAPEGVEVELGRGTSSAHPIGLMQNSLKSLLGLEHQLEWVDYTRKNFVHADLSPKQFRQRMKERGESFLKMYFEFVGQEMARQSKKQTQGQFGEVNLLAAFFSRDRARELRIALAPQFEGVETMLAGFGGPDGSTIVTERNKVALDVLRRELEKGRKRLGIFYGAGHMVDMHERLERDFHMKAESVIWVDAWDLRR